MTFKTLEELEGIKESIHLRAENEITNLYILEVKKVLKWFRAKFPKRHLRWVDGMGCHFWVLDGDIWDCGTYHHATIYRDGSYDGQSRYLTEREWTKKEVLLKPLVDFFSSMTDESWVGESGIQIGEWEIDRVSKEIRSC